MQNKGEAFAPFASLADRFAILVRRLDSAVEEAIKIQEGSSPGAPAAPADENFQTVVGLLDESLLQLHVWASDVSYQNFPTNSGSLAMRDVDAHAVLNIIDTCGMPVAEHLRRIFETLEVDVLSILRILALKNQGYRQDWTSRCADLYSTTCRIQQAILELDNKKSTIDAQITRADDEDIERAVLSGNLFGKGTVLSIDGGGVRSYSSILIIKALMDQVRSVINDAEIADIPTQASGPANVQPADVFEYFFGSSSGGLLAIMLGRLKMQEDQCLEKFIKYSNQIFSHPRVFHRVPGLYHHKYSAENLNRAIDSVVGDFDPNPDSLKWKRSIFATPGDRCKTGVIAYELRGPIGFDKIFRTYHRSFEKDVSLSNPTEKQTFGEGLSSSKPTGNQTSERDLLLSKPTKNQISEREPPLSKPIRDYHIWEVARATSAAPGYFDPMVIGRLSFIDGGFGNNNPSLHALREVQVVREAKSSRTRLSRPLIVSIGSGSRSMIAETSSISERKQIMSVARSLITDTQRIHADMVARARHQEVEYFRFEVDAGLANVSVDSWEVKKRNGKKVWSTVEQITEATETYLRQQTVVDQLRRCARLLVQKCSSKYDSTQSVSGLSTIPYKRNLNFVGREDVLCRATDVLGMYKQVALVGLGGVGKTQIALELGYRYRTTHPKKSIFWIQADTSSTFERSIRSLAEVLQLHSRRDPEANIFELVYNWLSYEARDGWLMIVDNVDDEEALDHVPKTYVSQSSDSARISTSPFSVLLPQNPESHILITSRSKAVACNIIGNQESVIDVGLMPADESIELFHKSYSGIWDRNDAYQVCQTLGFFPLAITQVAAYLNQRVPRLTARTYLAEFQKNPERLLKSDTASPVIHGKTLENIWQTSFEQIMPSARQLLSLMCLCGPDAIPDYLARKFEDESDVKSEMTVDLDFEDAISTLTNYSLIKISGTGQSFYVHQLVQIAMRRYLELTAELDKWKTRYVKILSSILPKDLYGEWSKCGQLSPHVDTALAYRPADEQFLHNWIDVVFYAADYAKATGNYEMAEQLHLQVLEEVEKALGGKHPTTFASIDKLGSVYLYNGKFDAAEAMIRRALEGRQEILGLEHPDTMTSYNNLAILLRERGDYAAATQIFQQTLAERERTLGPEHPSTLRSFQYLGLVFADRGRFEEAEEMNSRALQSYKRVLGLEHPDTLFSISNLASTYLRQGRFMDAEELVRGALPRYEKVLGSEHPLTLASMGNLAASLTEQGELLEAEEMSRRTLRRQEKALVPQHPDILASMNNLAIILRCRDKFEEAERMSRQALEGRQMLLGSVHPDTLASMDELAITLHYQAKHVEAEEIIRRAVQGLRKALGSEHPGTLASMNNLAIILRGEEKFEEAEYISREALQGLEKVLGFRHPSTVASRETLERILQEQRKRDAGSEVTRQALHGQPPRA